MGGGGGARNLEPLLNLYKAETSKPVPSWRVFVDWKSTYFASDRNILSLVPKHKQKGNRTKKLSSQQLVLEAINKKYLTKERWSVAEVFQYYKSRVIEENRNNPDGKIRPLSKRTFYNRIRELRPYDVAVGRYGKRYADRVFKMVDHILPATFPMEYVEIDHTPAPVMLLDDDLELPLGRPYLTILYDRYTGCIVGLYAGFRDPSFESVRSAFLNATLPKDWLKDKYPSIDNDWPCHGKITHLVVDNGAEFWSDDLDAGSEAEQLKIELGRLNTRTLGKDGIRLHNLRYYSKELVAYKKRSAVANRKGATLKVKTDPDDISYIYVYLEEDKCYLKVPVIKDYSHIEGVSLYQHERICTVRRLNTRLKKDDEALADTYLYIDRRIDGEVERIKNRNYKKSTLPKTSNLSKIVKYQKVGSEGPTSIATKKTNKQQPLADDIDKQDDVGGLDLSDIDGY